MMFFCSFVNDITLSLLIFLPGLLITFFFLALTSTCKPFCTEGLSRLHALTLVAQFISLFGGLVLIVEEFISEQLAAANESDNTSIKTSIIHALVFLCNGAVVGWPIIQFLLLKSPLEIVEIIQAKIKNLTSGTDVASSENVGGSSGGSQHRSDDSREEQPAQFEVEVALDRAATLPSTLSTQTHMQAGATCDLVYKHELPLSSQQLHAVDESLAQATATVSLGSGAPPESTPVSPQPAATLPAQLGSVFQSALTDLQKAVRGLHETFFFQQQHEDCG
jgi:hypothetical protein